MTRRAHAVAVVGCMLATLVGASPASAERRQCPPGQRPGISGCVAATPRARSVTPSEPKKSAAPPASEPKVDREGDTRALKTADKRLLLTELAQLEALLQQTKKGSPDRVTLLRRLAEGYAELERLAVLERETAKLRAERAARDDAERPRVRGTM